jgi:hypothetical protein
MIERLKEIHESSLITKQKFDEFEGWRITASRMLNGTFSDKSISKDFSTETKVLLNKFSDVANIEKLDAALNEADRYLESVKVDIESGKYVKNDNDSIEKTVALTIFRRILRNFHKHIEAMYQDVVHGNGKIKRSDLDRIRIGNEYDIQRILYSLIRPIFPEARLEVVDDAGYNSVRYDIVLNEYDIVIEVKCTRGNMTQRKLTEELGADSFHYKADHLFLFIFDQIRLIDNPEAFEKSFNRQKQDYGKEIETIVIQEITF